MQAYCSAQVLSSYVDEIYKRFPIREDKSKPCISQASYLAWVEAIDKEFNLLKGVMKSDKQRFAQFEEDRTKQNAQVQMALFNVQ